MMPPTLSITCKTVQLHANSPVSRPEVDLKVTTGISLVLIGLLWQRERAWGEGREGAGEIQRLIQTAQCRMADMCKINLQNKCFLKKIYLEGISKEKWIQEELKEGQTDMGHVHTNKKLILHNQVPIFDTTHSKPVFSTSRKWKLSVKVHSWPRKCWRKKS